MNCSCSPSERSPLRQGGGGAIGFGGRRNPIDREKTHSLSCERTWHAVVCRTGDAGVGASVWLWKMYEPFAWQIPPRRTGQSVTDQGGLTLGESDRANPDR